MNAPVDLLIIGAGPAGISCAIEGTRAGLSVILLDQGGIADAIRRFPVGLVWFSTPPMLEVGGIPFVTSTVRPTRVDTLNYYRRVCEHERLDVRTHDAATAVQQEGETFRVLTEQGAEYQARNVVVATGYFDTPTRLGVPGEDARHVRHSYDEPFAYAGSRVVVVGGRNSAVEAALDLFRHGVSVTLIHRGPSLSPGVKAWVLPDIENRLKAGEIVARFSSVITRIDRDAVAVRTPNGEELVPAAFVFVLIGFRPDTELLGRFGLQVHPETSVPFHDPGTYQTTVPGLYVAGSVVAGKNNNAIFVENGRLHGAPIVRSILAARRHG